MGTQLAFKGIIHNDLHSGNIVVDDKYNFRLIDFGRSYTVSGISSDLIDSLNAEYNAKHIILATGGRSRELPNLKQDGKQIIGYRQAMVLSQQPKSLVVVGSGAIGVEFAYFYNSIGTQVTIVEYLDNIVPVPPAAPEMTPTVSVVLSVSPVSISINPFLCISYNTLSIMYCPIAAYSSYVSFG
jgi:thioredoxin reductase